MSEYVIETKDVWKKFPVSKDTPGFKELIVNFGKFLRKGENNYFFALKGLNLRIKKGECVGIIGRNGAGKSTLLSLLLGAIQPTRGTVRINERITPLLELGAGFHPDLTGRENILINGVLLGLTRDEVSKKIDSIIDFTEIQEFISMPLRTYSSGMYMRLAFAVAIHIDPKLLLIDEILSVGDESFQKKSKAALLKLIKSGVTTVFVSHDLGAVKEICHRAIWLDHGEIRAEGEPQKVIEQYKSMVYQK